MTERVRRILMRNFFIISDESRYPDAYNLPERSANEKRY
jgi:hypothetical protein